MKSTLLRWKGQNNYRKSPTNFDRGMKTYSLNWIALDIHSSLLVSVPTSFWPRSMPLTRNYKSSRKMQSRWNISYNRDKTQSATSRIKSNQIFLPIRPHHSRHRAKSTSFLKQSKLSPNKTTLLSASTPSCRLRQSKSKNRLPRKGKNWWGDCNRLRLLWKDLISTHFKLVRREKSLNSKISSLP